MLRKVPNYLYPLQTDRALQWTRDIVRGERKAKEALEPEIIDASKKKNIIRSLIRDKQMTLRYGKPLLTQSYSNPVVRAYTQKDAMQSPDPRTGNPMHIANTKAMYNR